MLSRLTSRHPMGGVIALLAAGWFIHDAVLHAALLVFGMNWLLGLEFSLPDLTKYNISPDRAIQTFALLFAVAAASALLSVGLRHRR